MHGHRHDRGSLESSLAQVAQRWEQERATEAAALRRQVSEANRHSAAESAKLKQEQQKREALENQLKEQSAKLLEANAKLKEATAEGTKRRLQAIGSFLLVAEISSKIKALSPTPANTNQLALADDGTIDSASKALTAILGADDGDEEEEDDVVDEAAAATGDGEATRKKKKKKKQQQKKKKGLDAASAARDPEANGGGGAKAEAHGAEEEAEATGAVEAEAKELTGSAEKSLTPADTAVGGGGVAPRTHLIMGAEEWGALQEVMEPLPASISAADLLDACNEGKSRFVDSFFSQYTLTDLVEERAQEALVAGLEASAVHGRGQMVKALVDGGADAHRTNALHLCIRHGHVSILNHLVSSVAMSVNTLDEDGSSPLHVAAEANQPKAAQFLMKQCASVDARNAEGKTALEIATAMRWKEMQKVLQDPGTLFWNRSARATKLYKQGEFEEACDSYALALKEFERMAVRPAADTQATFFFNYGRSAQSSGSLTRASELLSRVLELNERHERALEHHLDCLEGLSDFEGALSDLRELKVKFSDTADIPTRQGWVRREAQLKAKIATPSHELLGVERYATAAQVKKAYRNLCLQYHPDKHANSAADVATRAKHKFARIQQAYEKLSASAPESSFASGFRSHDYDSNPFADFQRRSYRPGAPSYTSYASTGAGTHGDDEEEDDDEYEEDEEDESSGQRTQWDSPGAYARGRR